MDDKRLDCIFDILGPLIDELMTCSKSADEFIERFVEFGNAKQININTEQLLNLLQEEPLNT